MSEILIEIHYTEDKHTFKAFLDYFKTHPIKNCTFKVSKESKCPDFRISINDIVVHVGEIKHDADPRASRDSMHLYNNLNPILRHYPDAVYKWLIIVDHNKKGLRWDNKTKRKKMLPNIDKVLLGQLMHEGYAHGFETRYVTYEHFIGLIMDEIVKYESEVIDIGHHFLEKKGCYQPKTNQRRKCSQFETSLPAYKGITVKRSFYISQRYSNMFEFIKNGVKIINEKGEEVKGLKIIPAPERLDLDDIIPLNKKKGKTKHWANFMTAVFGSIPIIKKKKKLKKINV